MTGLKLAGLIKSFISWYIVEGYVVHAVIAIFCSGFMTILLVQLFLRFDRYQQCQRIHRVLSRALSRNGLASSKVEKYTAKRDVSRNELKSGRGEVEVYLRFVMNWLRVLSVPTLGGALVVGTWLIRRKGVEVR